MTASVPLRHRGGRAHGGDAAGGRGEATARFLGIDGKKFRFEVVAHDPAGEIGRGRHDRAIVKKQRLLDGAARRRGGG